MSKKKFLSFLLLGLILISFYVLLSNLPSVMRAFAGFITSAFTTFFLGIILAFILNIPASFFENKIAGTKIRLLAKSSRGAGIILSLVIFFLVCALILGFIIPATINAVKTLASSILVLSDMLQGHIVENEPSFEAALHTVLTWLDMSLDELYQVVEEFARINSPRIITSTFNTILGTISGAVTFFIAIVFAIYFVTSKEMIARHLTSLIAMLNHNEISTWLSHVSKISYKAFRHFIVAQVLEAIIIGSLCAFGMFILGLPNATMIGVLVGVTALIPVYGAFVGAIFGAIVIAVTSPLEALFFLLFILILQQLEGNLIYPRVVGGSLGLPPVYTFILVTLCGSVFGLLGMLFAVPVGSIVYTLLKEKKQKMDIQKAESWIHTDDILRKS